MWPSPNDHRKPADSTEISESGESYDEDELVEAEITLLCETIDSLLDSIQLHASLSPPTLSAEQRETHADCFETGIQAFDRLDVCEQLAIIRSISAGLVDEKSLGESESSSHDAAIAVLINCVRENIEIELDFVAFEDEFNEGVSWRQMVRDAAIGDANLASEGSEEDVAQIPSASDVDMDHWSSVIDGFADRWLPDHDYALENLFLDADPNQSTLVKETLGINNDYFIEEIDELKQEDFAKWMAETRQIIRRKPR